MLHRVVILILLPLPLPLSLDKSGVRSGARRRGASVGSSGARRGARREGTRGYRSRAASTAGAGLGRPYTELYFVEATLMCTNTALD